jgi:hypothetical protein
VETDLEGEGGNNTTDGYHSTRRAELRASVSFAPMEAQAAPATDPNTIIKIAGAAAAVGIDMCTAVSTVTAATPSTASANDPDCFDNLPPELRTLVSDKKDPPLDTGCRPPTSGSAISASIETDGENYYQCGHTPHVLNLNTAEFGDLRELFPTWTVHDYRDVMAPHIRLLTGLSIADEVMIRLADDGLEQLTLSYTLVLDRTGPESPVRPKHEPFRLALGHDRPQYKATHADLHNDEYHSRLLSLFQILEMAVYSLIFDVFTPTLSKASSVYKFIKAMGATHPSELDPAAHLATLDFEIGMLSKHMFDLWISEAKFDRFLCLIYRFQFSRQNDDNEEPKEEFWLDDGTPLEGKDQNNVMAWRAVFETSQRYDLPSHVYKHVETVVRSTHTDDIFHCPLTLYVKSGRPVPREELIRIAEVWEKHRAKLFPNTPEPKGFSKETVEAFMVEHDVKACMADDERTGWVLTIDVGMEP